MRLLVTISKVFHNKYHLVTKFKIVIKSIILKSQISCSDLAIILFSQCLICLVKVLVVRIQGMIELLSYQIL